VAQEAQSQQQLEVLATTGRAQLRLQQTVEGLSVAGISYYVLSLAGYALKPFEWGTGAIRLDTILAVLVPLVAGLVWIRVRRQRRSGR